MTIGRTLDMLDEEAVNCTQERTEKDGYQYTKKKKKNNSKQTTIQSVCPFSDY